VARDRESDERPAKVRWSTTVSSSCERIRTYTHIFEDLFAMSVKWLLAMSKGLQLEASPNNESTADP
jgi:hypothetical protein